MERPSVAGRSEALRIASGAEQDSPLERESELAGIGDALAGARAGTGSMLVIEGPAGIGKSRLMRQARRFARGSDMTELTARGAELERGHPFGLVSSLFEEQLRRGGSPRLLQGRAAMAAPLLSPEASDVAPGPTDEFALLHGLYWAIVNLAEEQPVAILVDDVHWADDLSLRFLVYLAQRLSDLPVALIVAVRSGDPAGGGELLSMLLTATALPFLRPRELSEEAVYALLVEADMKLAESEGFVRASWRATRGNPFLLRELLAALAQEQTGESKLNATTVAAFAPQSVARSVVVRLTRLGPEALALAQACAVLGSKASLPRGAELADLDLASAGEAAEVLVGAQIFESAEPVAFAHPMIQSAVYAELPPAIRLRTHLKAARMLNQLGAGPVEVGRHLLSGAPCDEPWALDVLHEAGRIAARTGAPETALRYMSRALDLDPLGQRSGPLLVDLGLVEAAAGEQTSLERFERALSLIEAPQEQARALYALGQTLYRYGRAADAADTFRRGAGLFQDRDHELWLMFEGAVICCAMQLIPIRSESMARLEQLVAEIPDYRQPTAAERTLLAVHSTNLALTAAPSREAVAVAHLALGDGALLREQTSESLAVNLAIIGLVLCGEAADAQRYVDEVLADARTRGAALAFAEASMTRAMVMLARGRINDAIADAQAAVEGIERGWRSLIPVPQAVLALCLVERGDLDAAESVLQDVEPLLPAAEARGLNAQFFGARGVVRLARGLYGDALSDLLHTGELLASYGYANPATVPWRAAAALAAFGSGDSDLASRLIDEEIALDERFGLTVQLGSALRVRAVLRDHDIEVLESSVAVLERADAPLELARALVDLGGAHRRAGRRTASREPLRRALELAHQRGATVTEQLAMDELLASGARPRRRMTAGVEALTPSERRIAELVAEGLTNRAVAEALFLTKGTVEWHLKHIYSKLDVKSRDSLASVLASASPSDEDADS